MGFWKGGNDGILKSDSGFLERLQWIFGKVAVGFWKGGNGFLER